MHGSEMTIMNNPLKKLSLRERSENIGKNLMAIETADDSSSTVHGMTGNLQSKLIELQKEVDRVRAETGVNKVLLSRLHKTPGRQRTLTEQEYIDLRENLRSNKLITPLTVRKRDDGDWDIISGHNRFDVYVDLGRTEIEVFVIDADNDDDADMKAFYANLLHPSLCDFEKYCRYKERSLKHQLSVTDLSKESGVNSSTISKLFYFDKLPDYFLSEIKKRPDCLGVTGALSLHKIIKNNKEKQAFQALQELVSNPEMTQEAALKLAQHGTEVIPSPKPPTPQIFKIGRQKFAELKSADNFIRITLAHKDDRAELTDKINKLIDDHVKNKSPH